MNRTLAISLALIAAVIAGCGGSDSGISKAEYEKQVTAAGQSMAKTLTGMSSSVVAAATPQDAAARLDEAGDELDGVAKTFADIDPPSDIADAHRELVDGVRGLASDIHQASGVAESGDTAALARIGSTLQGSRAAMRIQDAGKEIEAKGYKLDR